MLAVLDSFCVYHITAPGQESGAPDLPDDYTFPSLDELSEQVNSLIDTSLINTLIHLWMRKSFNHC